MRVAGALLAVLVSAWLARHPLIAALLRRSRRRHDDPRRRQRQLPDSTGELVAPAIRGPALTSPTGVWAPRVARETAGLTILPPAGESLVTAVRDGGERVSALVQCLECSVRLLSVVPRHQRSALAKRVDSMQDSLEGEETAPWVGAEW
eukprot:COSAG01_NODE_23897_length_797_cov_82.789398_1_plen_148_part_01